MTRHRAGTHKVIIRRTVTFDWPIPAQFALTVTITSPAEMVKSFLRFAELHFSTAQFVMPKKEYF